MLCKLTAAQKKALLNNLPKNAHYIRKAITTFWQMGLQQCTTKEDGTEDLDHVGSESIWSNHRFKIYTDYHVRAFFTDIVETTKL